MNWEWSPATGLFSVRDGNLPCSRDGSPMARRVAAGSAGELLCLRQVTFSFLSWPLGASVPGATAVIRFGESTPQTFSRR